MAVYRKPLRDKDGNRVVPPIADLLYPVGSIYLNTDLSTPEAVSVAIGGTWERWGEGKAPAGIDTAQTEFNASEKTGGSKTVTMVNNNIPRAFISVAHVGYMEAEFYSEGIVSYSRGTTGLLREGDHKDISSTTYGHTYTFGKSTPDGINNLAPYITCYMYKRIA